MGVFPSAQARIRQALGGRLREDPVELVIEDRVPPKIASLAKRAHRARREAERAATRAQREVASAAKDLAELGLSRRDSAAPRPVASAGPTADRWRLTPLGGAGLEM